MGADVVMSRPTITDVPALRGRRIGVEPGAVGAVMLDALLSSRGMLPQEVQVVQLQADQHVAAFVSGQVDAVVTFEPARSQLRAVGARTLFSSAEVPGRIIDTLAVRQDGLAHWQPALASLVAAHFSALALWQADPAGTAPLMAPRLSLKAEEVAGAYADLDFPDAAANLGWLRAEGGRLGTAARTLMAVMLRAGLLPEPVDLDGLADSCCLPQPVPAKDRA
jgi:NitT/TauT family transport system substrate-binding protein